MKGWLCSSSGFKSIRVGLIINYDYFKVYISDCKEIIKKGKRFLKKKEDLITYFKAKYFKIQYQSVTNIH